MEPTPTRQLRISLLIPCYNEATALRKSIESWLAQSRPADQIVVVDDCSTDDTPNILAEYRNRGVITVRPEKNCGNKSHAQEFGLQFVTGDIFVTTDGDTLLDKDFLKYVEEDFANPNITALGGRVRSLKYNWLTACRALDYAIGNHIDKRAQDCINFIFVIPGAAGAFRTEAFKKHISFTHDTITEDLDFTYRLHKLGLKITYDPRAVCYTQDPTTLGAYINQTRRWLGGGWQNFTKHIALPNRPGMALELSLIYIEGIVFSLVLFITPLVNLWLALNLLALYFGMCLLLALVCAMIEKRKDFIITLPIYVLLKYLNAYIFLEQFVKEVILKKKTLSWFKPERVEIA